MQLVLRQGLIGLSADPKPYIALQALPVPICGDSVQRIPSPDACSPAPARERVQQVSGKEGARSREGNSKHNHSMTGTIPKVLAP